VHADAENGGQMDFAGGLLQGGQFTVEPVKPFEDVFAGLVKNLACRRQLDRPFFPVNQLNFVLHFNLSQLLRNSGLTDAVNFSGAGEIFQLC